MKVCVLQPDYSSSIVDYRHYDPPRDLSALLPGHTVDHVMLDKRTTYAQLERVSTQGYDIFVNLCEGYLDWDVPSIDVIESLERLDLPYTGPTPALYDPSKSLMKYVAHTAGVRTPSHVLIRRHHQGPFSTQGLRYPLFVKPAHAGDSLGIDEHSLVHDERALHRQIEVTRQAHGDVLVEEFVDGREFTVLVMAGIEPGDDVVVLAPVEYQFPASTAYKTYALKTSDLHPSANIAVTDHALAARLQDAAKRVFDGFAGVGYARMDFRLDAHGALFFLEVNFTCSVFYPTGSEGSADHILALDGLGQDGFATHIIAEGIARHRRAQKPWEMRGNSIAGYGIFATRDLAEGDAVFRGEGRPHRIITAREVATYWTANGQRTFRQYAYPLSDELYVLWSDDPTAWAPQNHSCEANTAFDGLNVVASRPIAAGEELTLDYAAFMNEQGESFACCCGAAQCRGTVSGTVGNSVTAREASLATGPAAPPA